jgi:hypothetical protein
MLAQLNKNIMSHTKPNKFLPLSDVNFVFTLQSSELKDEQDWKGVLFEVH